MECPRDHSVLVSGVYEGDVEVDMCLSCQGIWLDKGEIERLEVFFERSRMEAREIRKGFWKSLITLFGK